MAWDLHITMKDILAHAIVIAVASVLAYPVGRHFGYEKGIKDGTSAAEKAATFVAFDAARQTAERITEKFIEQRVKDKYSLELQERERAGYDQCVRSTRDADDLRRFYRAIKEKISEAERTPTSRKLILAAVIVAMRKQAIDSLSDIARRSLNGKLDDLEKAVSARDHQRVAQLITEIQGTMEARDTSFGRALDELQRARSISPTALR